MDTYNRIRQYLGERYETSDDELINIYCDTYAFFCRLRDELEKQDLMMEYTNKAGATNYVKNPLAIELTKTVQTLNNLLKSLGLTAAQRKEAVGGGKDGEENEKDDFEAY